MDLEKEKMRHMMDQMKKQCPPEDRIKPRKLYPSLKRWLFETPADRANAKDQEEADKLDNTCQC